MPIKATAEDAIENAEAIGLAALVFLTEDEDRLGRFLSETGLSPDDLRASAGTREGLVAVLDHLLADESLADGVRRGRQASIPWRSGRRGRCSPADADARQFASANYTSGHTRDAARRSGRPSAGRGRELRAMAANAAATPQAGSASTSAAPRSKASCWRRRREMRRSAADRGAARRLRRHPRGDREPGRRRSRQAAGRPARRQRRDRHARLARQPALVHRAPTRRGSTGGRSAAIWRRALGRPVRARQRRQLLRACRRRSTAPARGRARCSA